MGGAGFKFYVHAWVILDCVVALPNAGRGWMRGLESFLPHPAVVVHDARLQLLHLHCIQSRLLAKAAQL